LKDFRHGPGAAIGAVGGNDAYFKWASLPYAVSGKVALAIVRDTILSDDRWSRAILAQLLPDICLHDYSPSYQLWWLWDELCDKIIRVYPANRITTVPKDWSKDRTIAVEAAMNVYIQLGYDAFVRRRLKRVGVDLQYGQETNRLLSYQGSIDGSLATIDLSSASDTVSSELIDRVFPPRWSSLLHSLSHRKGRLPHGETISYEKISSMGNALTFTCETLIFYALARAVADTFGIRLVPGKNFAVYGDDIIMPSSLTPCYLECLQAIGFYPNLDKTFVDGPIRESCGKEFYHGVEIRPLYLNSQPTSVVGLLAHFNTLFVRLWRLGLKSARFQRLADRWLPKGTPGGPVDLENFSSWRFSLDAPSRDIHGSYHHSALVLVPRKVRAAHEYSLLMKASLGHVEERLFFPSRERELLFHASDQASVNWKNQFRVAVISRSSSTWDDGRSLWGL